MTPDELRTLADAATPASCVETPVVPNRNEARIWNTTGQTVASHLHDEDARIFFLAPDLARVLAELAEAADRIFGYIEPELKSGPGVQRLAGAIDRVMELQQP